MQLQFPPQQGDDLDVEDEYVAGKGGITHEIKHRLEKRLHRQGQLQEHQHMKVGRKCEQTLQQKIKVFQLQILGTILAHQCYMSTRIPTTRTPGGVYQ